MTSITDELREYAEDWDWLDTGAERAQDRIEAIADRIDAEHERAVMSAMNDALYHANDESMAELGWVRLPKDADGVPIHVGDVLNPPAGCEDYAPLLVMRLTYDGYENEWFFDGDAGGFCGMVGEHMDVAGWTHHHAPTVEDVLHEFVGKALCVSDLVGEDELVTEYAAKVREVLGE